MQFDTQFVERLLQYDELAFAQLYEHTVDQFFRYIMSHYSLDEQEAHDLVADVYVKIWDNIDKYDEQYQFGQFIWTILKNHCKDYFKKMKPLFFSELEHNDESQSIIETFHDVNRDGEESDLQTLFEKDFQYDLIQQAIRSLDQESQELLHARFVLCYDYDMIASMTGIKNPALRKKLSRLCQKLQQQLSYLSEND